MNSLSEGIVEKAKKLAFRHTKLGAPTYPYQIEPIQLASLIMELERPLSGNVVEIGVARGMTTRFMAEHMQKKKTRDTLYAIDTFSSFTKEDLDYEKNRRGKNSLHMMPFTYNDFDAWRRNFTAFPFVVAIKGDCSQVDYSRLGPIRLAFLDVDLYLPTKNTLPKLWKEMVPGGVILVDDVREENSWDGSYQAYMEFCKEHDLTPQIIGNKCGKLSKP